MPSVLDCIPENVKGGIVGFLFVVVPFLAVMGFIKF